MKLYQVIEVVVVPGEEPQRNPIRRPMPQAKAEGLRDKLNDKQEDYNPNKVISYLIQPSN